MAVFTVQSSNIYTNTIVEVRYRLRNGNRGKIDIPVWESATIEDANFIEFFGGRYSIYDLTDKRWVKPGNPGVDPKFPLIYEVTDRAYIIL